MPLEGWPSKKAITLTIPPQPEELLNYPLLVAVNGSMGIDDLNGSPMALDISDTPLRLAAYDVDNDKECRVELCSFGDKFVLRVRVPVVSAVSDTKIRLYYDSDHIDNNIVSLEDTDIVCLVEGTVPEALGGVDFFEAISDDLLTAGTASYGLNARYDVLKYTQSFYAVGNIGMDVPYNDDLNLRLNDWTIEVWINMAGVTGVQRILGKAQDTNLREQYYVYIESDRRVRLTLSSGADGGITNYTTGVVPASGWTHLAFERYGDIIAMYIDGVLDKSFGYSNNIYSGIEYDLGVCTTSYNNTDNFNGALDQLLITLRGKYGLAGFTPPSYPLSLKNIEATQSRKRDPSFVWDDNVVLMQSCAVAIDRKATFVDTVLYASEVSSAYFNDDQYGYKDVIFGDRDLSGLTKDNGVLKIDVYFSDTSNNIQAFFFEVGSTASRGDYEWRHHFTDKSYGGYNNDLVEGGRSLRNSDVNSFSGRLSTTYTTLYIPFSTFSTTGENELDVALINRLTFGFLICGTSGTRMAKVKNVEIVKLDNIPQTKPAGSLATQFGGVVDTDFDVTNAVPELQLSGTSGLSLTDSGDADLIATFSIQAVIRPTTLLDNSATVDSVIVSRREHPTASVASYALVINPDGQLELKTGAGTVKSTKASWSAGQEYFVVATYDENGAAPIAELWVDGTKETLATNTPAVMVGGDNETLVGALDTSGTDGFEGSVRNVVISDEVLSDGWIQTSYLNETDALFSAAFPQIAVDLPSLYAVLDGVYGEDIAGTMLSMTSDLIGTEVFIGTVAAELPSLTASIHKEFVPDRILTADLPSMSAHVVTGRRIVAELLGMKGSLVGQVGRRGDIAGTISSLTAKFYSGNLLKSDLPRLYAGIKGSNEIIARMSGTIKPIECTISGDSEILSQIDASLRGMYSTGHITNGAVGSIAGIMPSIGSDLEGIRGIVAELVARRLPRMKARLGADFSAAGDREIHATLPSLDGSLGEWADQEFIVLRHERGVIR